MDRRFTPPGSSPGPCGRGRERIERRQRAGNGSASKNEMVSYSHGEISNARLWFVSPYPGGSSLQREKKDPSTQGNAVHNVAQMCHR